jgi:hypothetical protein
MAEVTEQIVREAPDIEAYKLGLLQSAKALADKPVSLPAQQIAGLSPLQQMAFGSAETGVGAYLPYLQEAGYTLGDAQTALGGVMAGATPYQQQALSGLQQAQAGIQPQVAASQLGVQNALGLGQGYTSGAIGGLGQAATSGAQVAQQARAGAMGLGAQALPQFGQATQTGIGAYQAALQGLGGTTGQFDPSQIATYQSPYEDLAVQQALSDIARQGQIQQQALGAQAAAQGAFGGSRQAIAEQELARNVLEQQGRTAAQMRAAGFESAAQRAQTAFEQQQARAQQAAVQGGQFGLNTAQLQAANAQALAQTGLSLEQLAAQTGLSSAQLAGQLSGQAGQLGQGQAQLGITGALEAGKLGLSGQQLGGQLAEGIAGLGTQYGQLGLQQGEALGTLGLRQASLGQQAQQLGQQQAGFLFDLGQKQQQQQQAELEAQRQTALQQAYEPYQRVGFLSDIYKGAPTTQQSITAGTTPTTSAAEKFLGLGIAGLSAAAGASKAGLF